MAQQKNRFQQQPVAKGPKGSLDYLQPQPQTGGGSLDAATAGNMGGGTAKPALNPKAGNTGSMVGGTSNGGPYHGSERPVGNSMPPPGAQNKANTAPSAGPANITEIPIEHMPTGPGTAGKQLGGQDRPAY